MQHRRRAGDIGIDAVLLLTAPTHFCSCSSSQYSTSTSHLSALSAQHLARYLAIPAASLPHTPTYWYIYMDSSGIVLSISYHLNGEGLSDRPVLPVAANGISIGWAARRRDLELRIFPNNEFLYSLTSLAYYPDQLSTTYANGPCMHAW